MWKTIPKLLYDYSASPLCTWFSRCSPKNVSALIIVIIIIIIYFFFFLFCCSGKKRSHHTSPVHLTEGRRRYFWALRAVAVLCLCIKTICHAGANSGGFRGAYTVARRDGSATGGWRRQLWSGTDKVAIEIGIIFARALVPSAVYAYIYPSASPPLAFSLEPIDYVIHYITYC